MKIFTKIVFFILLACTCVHAQELLNDMKETSTPVLNEELRKLRKSNSTVRGSISGGTTDQVLSKASDSDYDTTWVDMPSGAITGEVRIWSTGTPPTGWLICDGSAVSQATYSALYAVIGTTYGNPGGGNFNLPDMKGKVPVGYNAAETEFDALGETGGSKVPALLAHTHAVDLSGSSTGSGYMRITGAGGVGPSSYNALSAQSGSQTAGNLQPYITLNYIIKT